MQINKLSQSNQTKSLNFGKLYNGHLVQVNILEPNNKILKKELDSVSRLIRKENLHKTKNVDIILQYTEEKGFYGVISSKTQGTPMHPCYWQPVPKDENTLDKFINWVKAWDKLFS